MSAFEILMIKLATVEASPIHRIASTAGCPVYLLIACSDQGGGTWVHGSTLVNRISCRRWCLVEVAVNGGSADPILGGDLRDGELTLVVVADWSSISRASSARRGRSFVLGPPMRPSRGRRLGRRESLRT